MSEIMISNKIENKILTIRGQQVLIDRDVAELYGVETKKVNQAVSRNRDKFPDGYTFSLDSKEKSELVTICDHLNTLKYSNALETTADETTIELNLALVKIKHTTKRTKKGENKTCKT